jgi:hypothetical protein
MPETNTYGDLQTFIEKNKDQFATANQLWKKYGQEVPFKVWIDNQVLKAKASSWYKEGMNISEIVEGNKKADESKKSTSTTEGFKIAGMNGYLVIGGILVLATVGYVIYRNSKK